MSIKNTSLSERVAANFACVWLFACVGEHVVSESISVSEGLAAYLTGMRFLACMDQHVTAQARSIDKCHLKMITFVWFLPRCTILCLRIYDVEAKALPQISHTCGFSPVWMRICILRSHR